MIPLELRLYMKADCHLCEATRSDLERLRARHPHTLELVDITTDHELVRQYGERIPVLRVGDREYDAPLAAAVLERVLVQASAQQARANAAKPDTPSQARADRSEGGPR